MHTLDKYKFREYYLFQITIAGVVPIPESIGASNFFPNLGMPFTVLTDDDKSLICVTAQPKQRGGLTPHAIHSTMNNSLLGLYFRNRLNVASGDRVERIDLDLYGRTSVDFYKIDDDTYYMDFSPTKVV